MTDQLSVPPEPGPVVFGRAVDDHTRCAHYHGPHDIVTIQFRCCRAYYPCHLCHVEAVDHQADRWPAEEFDQPAILCGVCRSTLTIATYLEVAACPDCGAVFNDRCALHRDLYFAD